MTGREVGPDRVEEENTVYDTSRAEPMDGLEDPERIEGSVEFDTGGLSAADMLETSVLATETEDGEPSIYHPEDANEELVHSYNGGITLGATPDYDLG